MFFLKNFRQHGSSPNGRTHTMWKKMTKQKNCIMMSTLKRNCNCHQIAYQLTYQSMNNAAASGTNSEQPCSVTSLLKTCVLSEVHSFKSLCMQLKITDKCAYRTATLICSVSLYPSPTTSKQSCLPCTWKPHIFTKDTQQQNKQYY